MGRHHGARTKHDDKVRSHYDFSGGVRGKYADGTNAVVLAPDLAEFVLGAITVNVAFRTFVRLPAKSVVKSAPKKRIG